jgi:hypothetical protein
MGRLMACHHRSESLTFDRFISDQHFDQLIH